MGFGFLKTLASLKSMEFLNLSKTLYLELSLFLSFVTFVVCLFYYKKYEQIIKPMRSLLVPIIILICFPRIKVYDAVFALCSICYLPILMDIKLLENKILKPGGTVPAEYMVQDFLGRKWNDEAFLSQKNLSK